MIDGLVEQPICITRADGRVSVMQIIVQAPLRCFSTDAALVNGFVLNESGDLWVGGITDWGVENEIARTFPGEKVQSWRRMTDEETTAYFATGEFRGAHVDQDGKLELDLARARNIARAGIRSSRASQFEILDNAVKPLMAKAALGSLNPADRRTLADMEAKRQALRDAPASPAIDEAASVPELVAVIEAFRA